MTIRYINNVSLKLELRSGQFSRSIRSKVSTANNNDEAKHGFQAITTDPQHIKRVHRDVFVAKYLYPLL